MKRIAILGSTGSVGLQTLDVVRKYRDMFSVVALSCNSSISLMEEQIREFEVAHAAVCDEGLARELRDRVSIDVLDGIDGVSELAGLDHVDIVVNSLVGSIGIKPTISAIMNHKDVALANKETLVTAGEVIMSLTREYGTVLYPVDSEHSAIFQCLNGEDRGGIERIIITCSGGAFRDRKKEELHTLSSRDALQHPNWDMGQKITVDSATLMNKGFEVIEARMLFDLAYDQIEVVIHPQSIIHSLVEFSDRSVLAQLSSPDMRLPIQYALTYPDRMETGLEPLNLERIHTLTFSPPDTGRFPCLDYAYEAGRIGGTMPCVLNAANEVAVQAFLRGSIGFMDVPGIIRKKLDAHVPTMNPDIDELLELDERIKQETFEDLHRKAG